MGDGAETHDVKTCPWCWGQIPVPAVVCQLCGRAYLIGAAIISSFNEFYVLGQHSDSTPGIWSANGGIPVETFENSEAGWKIASTKFATVSNAAKPGAGGAGGFFGGVMIPLDLGGD